jgi:YVTN family beta-propeller protein
MPLAAATSRIYVLNWGGNTVNVIDTVTNKVVQNIEGIPQAHGVAFSPDGSQAYIVSETDGLFVVDTGTGKIIKKVTLSPSRPNLPAITKDGKRVFVCINTTVLSTKIGPDGNFTRSNIGHGVDVVDTTSFTKVKTLLTKTKTHDCYVTPDGKYLLVGGGMSVKYLGVIDIQTEQPAWEMSFDQGVLPIAMEANPDGSTRRLFVELNRIRGFAVVDFAAHREVARVQFPEKPGGFILTGIGTRRNSTPTHGSAISPDGKILAIVSRGSNAVFLYSLPELKLLGAVPTPTKKGSEYPYNGGDPGWASFTPDGKTLYVPNSELNSVSAIDVKTMKAVAEVPVGSHPDHVETLVLP